MTVIESIKSDLSKAKTRLSKIDQEIAALQKEKDVIGQKMWELEHYAELYEKENAVVEKQRKKRTKKVPKLNENEVTEYDARESQEAMDVSQ